MITLEVSETKKVPVKYLQAECGVRYWEDAKVNGEEDTDGTRIPCRAAEVWCPVIDVETGTIEGWPQGVSADIYYKVCDDGAYHLLDENRKVVKSINGYVPSIMCPEGDGYGDYVIMKIDGTGKIARWTPDLSDFQKADED